MAKLIIKANLLLILITAFLLTTVTCDLSNVEDYDNDYELLEDSDSKVNSVKQDEEETPPFNSGDKNDVEEIPTSLCSTRDRTRVCDCGFLSQVTSSSSIIQQQQQLPDFICTLRDSSIQVIWCHRDKKRTPTNSHSPIFYLSTLGLHRPNLRGQHAASDHSQLPAYRGARKHLCQYLQHRTPGTGEYRGSRAARERPLLSHRRLGPCQHLDA